MTLKELRTSKKISQSEAAKFLGVPLRSYKRYENEEKYKNTLKYNHLISVLSSFKKEQKEKKFIRKLNVVVVGIGFVGLSNGLLLSKKANVTMFDINMNKVDLLNKKICPFNDETFNHLLKDSKIKATSDIYIYKKADVIMIATSTDLDESTNTLDTFNVTSVVRTIREINKKCLIVIKSTVSVGLTKELISSYGNNIIFSPEFLREKNALRDVFYPSRIIFGCDKVTKRIENYKTLVESSIKNNVSVMVMKPSEAEATKLFSNTYLAMRIAFFNELDSFAYMNNLDSKEIIEGLGKDSRIGSEYNNPSFMFSGYCLPKDTKEVGTRMSSVLNNQLITSLNKSNESRLEFIKNEIIEKALDLSKKSKNEIVIGIYSLETNKIDKSYRESSSLRLLEALKKEGIKIIVYDPVYHRSEKDFNEFVVNSDLIVANTYSTKLKKYKYKLFTRN